MRKTLPLRSPVLLLVVSLTAGGPVAAGCGAGDQSRGGRVSGDTLTIYSSLPLQGPHSEQAESIRDAEKLALKDAGGKAGSFKVNFVSVDDATSGESREAGWSPNQTAENARRAAQGSQTIAYIGEFDSGASAVSIPITNEAGFVQVSPASTAVGLTKLVPGADKGEPDKFYPSAERTFARTVPADDVQASAAANWAKDMEARRVLLVNDKSVEGRGLVEQFRVAAERLGLRVVEEKRMDPRAREYRGVARDAAEVRPDLVYFGGGPRNAARLWRSLHEAVPRALLMGSDRLLVPSFYGRLRAAGERAYVTSSAQALRQLPPRGRRFVRAYRKEVGSDPDPHAAYGHAAMSLLLDAIRRAGDDANRRSAIVDRALETRDFNSAVGRFSLDDNGDTDLDRIAGYRVRDGRPAFERGLRGTPAGQPAERRSR